MSLGEESNPFTRPGWFRSVAEGSEPGWYRVKGVSRRALVALRQRQIEEIRGESGGPADEV